MRREILTIEISGLSHEIPKIAECCLRNEPAAHFLCGVEGTPSKAGAFNHSLNICALFEKKISSCVLFVRIGSGFRRRFIAVDFASAQ